MTAPICSTVCGAPAGAPGSGVYSATKIARETFQTIPFGPNVEVDFTSVEFDVGPAITPDLADNALVIEQDGFYEIIAFQSWISTPPSNTAIFIAVNDVPIVGDLFTIAPVAAKQGSLTTLLQLSAGDRVTLLASNSTSGAVAQIAARLSAEKHG